jgi:hypothetical protein
LTHHASCGNNAISASSGAYGVVSLHDVLIFAAGNFWRAAETLAEIKNNPAIAKSPYIAKQMKESLDGLMRNLHALNLPVSVGEFRKFNAWISAHVQEIAAQPTIEKQKEVFHKHNAEIQIRLTQLCSIVESELQSRLFFHMPTDRSDFWDRQWLTDTVIYTHFPKAHEEFQNAGRCYSYGEPTACVFHLMRVIDSGLRLVYASLGEQYDARNWDGIAKKIESGMSKKYQDKTEDWREREPFYSGVLTDIRSIGRAHRNPALHDIERKYTDAEAKYLIDITKAFMVHLAENGMKE